MIRTSNDEAAGVGDTMGEVILNNEIANRATSEVLGLKVYDLSSEPWDGRYNIRN